MHFCQRTSTIWKFFHKKFKHFCLHLNLRTMPPKSRPFVRNCVEVARVSPRKFVTCGDVNRAIKRKACARGSHFQHKGYFIRGFHLIYHSDLSFTKNVIRFLNAAYYPLVCLSMWQRFDSLKASPLALKRGHVHKRVTAMLHTFFSSVP